MVTNKKMLVVTYHFHHHPKHDIITSENRKPKQHRANATSHVAFTVRNRIYNRGCRRSLPQQAP